jgi:hypothetical protein
LAQQSTNIAHKVFIHATLCSVTTMLVGMLSVYPAAQQPRFVHDWWPEAATAAITSPRICLAMRLLRRRAEKLAKGGM